MTTNYVSNLTANNQLTVQTTGLTVVAYGQMTNAKQAQFVATKTANSTNVTGDGTLYQVPFDSIVYNVNSCYNSSTGTFTAPVAGTYLFESHVEITNISSSHTNSLLEVSVNASTNRLVYNFNARNCANSTTFFFVAAMSQIIPLSANDTVNMLLNVYGGTKTITVVGTGGYDTYFSGHLLA